MTRLPRPRGGFHLALLVVALVLSAGVATAVVGNAAPGDGPRRIVSVANTTNQLLPPDDAMDAATYGQADLDVAGAVAGDVERLEGNHQRLVLASQVAAVPDEGLSAVSEATLDSIETRFASIQTEYRGVLAAFANGSVTEATLTRRLAHLQIALDQQIGRLDALTEHLARRNPPLERELETRFGTLRGEAVAVDSPIAETLMAGINGSRPAVGYYIVGGPAGHVMASANGEVLHREATATANRTPGAPNTFAEAGAPTLAAFNRAAELYPWAFGNAIRQSAADFGTTQIYEITVEHDQGRLRTYLDGGTTDVFREIQVKDIPAVPITHTVSTTNEDLTLRLNTTTPTGPMQVRLTGAANDPVDGAIRIGGDLVGRTGQDGVLWTIQPVTGEPVNATVGGESVVVSP